MKSRRREACAAEEDTLNQRCRVPVSAVVFLQAFLHALLAGTGTAIDGIHFTLFFTRIMIVEEPAPEMRGAFDG